MPNLTEEIDRALALLRAHNIAAPLYSEEQLPSLLEQCQDICAALPAPKPIRTLHHFACTGGSLISKTLSGLANTILLSEIDPLSKKMIVPNESTPPFAPTDLIAGLRYASREVSEDVIIATFKGAVLATQNALALQGYQLILRDHAHSQFCTGVESSTRPTLLDLLHDTHPTLSLVTVRHPLDSFQSLTRNKWIEFSPATLNEYCRRYLQFLARYSGQPIIRYEDFVANPEETLEEICGHLQLPYSPLALDLLPAIRVSGDSGRSSNRIAERSRHPIPTPLLEEAQGSSEFQNLCELLGYK